MTVVRHHGASSPFLSTAATQLVARLYIHISIRVLLPLIGWRRLLRISRVQRLYYEAWHRTMA